MSTPERGAAEAAQRIADALEAAGLPYAIGGALALAVAVFKLLFFRGKDVVDLERLVAVAQDDLDCAYVRRWIGGMMGEDDERVRTWDELVARFGRPRSAG